MLYSIVDIETTGGGIKGNKITEIAIIRHDGNKIVDEFHSLVNPEKKIPYRIQQLTGISNDMVEQAPKFFEIAKEVLLKLRDTVFVAHNVNFDYNVIRNEYESLGGEFKSKKLCTVRLSRKAFPGYSSYSLGNICSALGIVIDDRHRAFGDAKATVSLFEKILKKNERDSFLDDSLNVRNKEATLPPHLPREEVERLPSKTGVYYFKNEEGKVIYVGKAKNIRQRILSHFYTKTRKEFNMLSQLHGIDYTLTGSEVVALLHESAEIKRIFPRFNRMQRRDNANIKVFHYTDGADVLRLTYGEIKAVQDPLRVFVFPVHARNFIEAIKEEYNLCPKYCGLQNTNGPCFDYHLKKCKGVCAGKESVVQYNKRVESALSDLRNESKKIVLTDKGKSNEERAFVLVENGMYLGYGYIPCNEEQRLMESGFDSFKRFLKKQKHNNDTTRIINQILRQDLPQMRIVEF